MSKINLAHLKEILKDHQDNPEKALDLLRTLLASTNKAAKATIRRIKLQILRCIQELENWNELIKYAVEWNERDILEHAIDRMRMRLGMSIFYDPSENAGL